MTAASNLATVPPEGEPEAQPNDPPRRGLLALVTLTLAALMLGVALAEVLVRITGAAASGMTDPIYRASTAEGVVYEFQPGARGYTWGRTWVEVNSLGLRGPEIAPEKPAGIVRVGVFGDSATFGQGVREEETYSRVLEHSSPRLQVLNFGVPSYNITNIVSTFSEKSTPLDLDVAVLAPIVEDYGFHRAHTVDAYGYPVHAASPVKPGMIKNTLRQMHLSYVIRDAWWALTGAGSREIQALDAASGDDPMAAATWQRAESELSRFVTRARQRHIKTIYLALGHQMPAQLAGIVSRMGFDAVIEVAPLLASYPQESLQVSRRDAHPSAFAHRLIAEILAPAIAK